MLQAQMKLRSVELLHQGHTYLYIAEKTSFPVKVHEAIALPRAGSPSQAPCLVWTGFLPLLPLLGCSNAYDSDVHDELRNS
jgi:hypothetical protein